MSKYIDLSGNQDSNYSRKGDENMELVKAKTPGVGLNWKYQQKLIVSSSNVLLFFSSLADE